jgi:two-component system sensor histidine kinase/response regulator
MDGIMLTRALRAQPVFKRLPIVLLTSVTQRDHVEEAKELDIQAYLVKPIRNAQLIQTIRSILVSSRDKPLLPPAPPAESSREPVNERTYNILLAEDNPVNQKVAVLMLTRLGYRVDVVENGREAVEASRSFSYDAILLDCQMPEMDGFDATRLIRQTQGGGFRVPIIALTASALAGERERCLAAGMDDYLSKPISQKLLGDRLASLLQTASHRDKEEARKMKMLSS